MLKMLLDPMGGIVLTNDGHAILREIEVSHPAAKSMIELSRTQDEEVGDGTTTVIILGMEQHLKGGDIANDLQLVKFSHKLYRNSNAISTLWLLFPPSSTHSKMPSKSSMRSPFQSISMMTRPCINSYIIKLLMPAPTGP